MIATPNHKNQLTPMTTSPSDSGNARFLHKPGMRLLRATIRTFDRTIPTVAVQIGWHVLSTPPRFAERPYEVQRRATAQTRWLQAGNKRLALYSWGPAQAPAVLLVHSWGGRAMQLASFIDPLLQHGLRVVAFDGPAHGSSSGRRTDMLEFPAALAAVAQHVGPLHAIVGHSFGAGMTQLALRHHGVGVNRVVMLSSFTDCLWITNRFGELFGVSPAVVQKARDKYQAVYPNLKSWQQLSVCDALQSHSVPTLIVHDTDDEEIPFVHAQRLHAAAPQHTQLVATTGLGHRRILRAPAVVAQVTRFVTA
jgi:pimeloyl-ACP methyl ester carboxylesterase